MSIGKVYSRLVEDLNEENDTIKTIYNIFNSFISQEISNFNASTYYSTRQYLSQSYKAGYLLED